MASKKKTVKMSSNVIGRMGDNFVVKDTPCLIPKENMGMFTNMQKRSQQSSFGNYPNPFNIFWKGQK